MIGSSDWRGTPMTGKGRDKEESGARRGERRRAKAEGVPRPMEGQSRGRKTGRAGSTKIMKSYFACVCLSVDRLREFGVWGVVWVSGERKARSRASSNRRNEQQATQSMRKVQEWPFASVSCRGSSSRPE